MKCSQFPVFALLSIGYFLGGCDVSASAADQLPGAAKDDTTASERDTDATSQEPLVKWFQLQNVTIPPDCSLRSIPKLTKPPLIFVEIKKNGERIWQSSTERGWTVDYPQKHNVFPVDEPDAIYTIQIWDDKWWNQNICNITGLKSDAFATTIYQKGGQYDTKERLLSVQFKEVAAPPH
jgi:hypothetical protein